MSEAQRVWSVRTGMAIGTETLIGLAAALGSGLLIGVERERRKGQGAARAIAGVRTFAIASLTGAVAAILDSAPVAATTIFGIAALALIARWRDRSDDPGITTEAALIATCLIGMLAMRNPPLAAGIAVAITGLLFLKVSIQRFATSSLSESELSDAIVLAALALILLPSLPNAPIHALVPINLHQVVRLVVVMSTIHAIGYLMLRIVGSRVGVSLSGFIAGFVSSTATHAAMGAKAQANPEAAAAYASAAILSNVATAIQALFVIATVTPRHLPALLPYLIAMTIVALICGAVAYGRAPLIDGEKNSRAFSLKQAFGFAALFSFVSGLTGWVHRTYGDIAATLTIALSAVADIHIAIGSLVGQPALSSTDLIPMLLICLTINALTKIAISVFVSRQKRYSLHILTALVIIAGTPWVVYVIG
jgi:uncharacterized membrane protein (DUF4010 family)